MPTRQAWNRIKLGSVVRLLSGGTPSKQVEEFWSGTIPWVTAKDMHRRFLSDAELHISDAGLSEGSNTAPPGSILLLVRGMSLHNEIRLCFADTALAFNQDIKAIVPDSGIDPLFLYYSLQAKTDELLELVDTASHGTGRIQTELLQNLELSVPSLEEQRCIGRLIRDFDGKIDSNRTAANILEEMAQAVFKSWFIDFDPVVAKSEGKKPFGMSDEIAALFPDSFEESELGAIPKGWKVRELSEEFEISMGQSPPGTSYNEDGVGTLFFQGRGEFGERYPIPRLYTTQPTRFAKKGDALVTVRAPVGDVNQSLDDCCIGRGLAAVRHRQQNLSYTFYRVRNFKDEFDQFNGDGTLFGAITADGFRGIKHIVPPMCVIEQYEKVVGPMDFKILNSYRESITLKKMRDALLPRLLSGELAIGRSAASASRESVAA